MYVADISAMVYTRGKPHTQGSRQQYSYQYFCTNAESIHTQPQEGPHRVSTCQNHTQSTKQTFLSTRQNDGFTKLYTYSPRSFPPPASTCWTFECFEGRIQSDILLQLLGLSPLLTSCRQQYSRPSPPPTLDLLLFARVLYRTDHFQWR